MPYVTCERCQLSVYSAARFATVDRCPGCGAELPRRRVDASLRDAVRRALQDRPAGRFTRHSPRRSMPRT